MAAAPAAAAGFLPPPGLEEEEAEEEGLLALKNLCRVGMPAAAAAAFPGGSSLICVLIYWGVWGWAVCVGGWWSK